MIQSARGRLALRGLQALSVLGLLLYAAQAGFTVCGSGANDFFETYVYNALIAAAAALCFARAAGVRHERAAWTALGTGLFLWAAAEAYYSIFLDRAASPPVPSVADALWLAFYPCCYVAIVLLIRGRVKEFRASLWLDGLVGALAAAAVGTALVVGPVTGVHDSRTMTMDLVYVLGDALLLAFVITFFALTAWRPGRAWAILGVGLCVGAVVDGYFVYQDAIASLPSTTLVASLWPASALLCGFAAWQQPAVARVRVGGLRVLTLPAVFGLAGVGVLAYQAVEPLHPLPLSLAVATLVAVIARMALTYRENLMLLESSRREALTDSLTGLANRRQLMQDLPRALAEATPQRPRGLMLFDLDGFKHYNDRFGHPLGDALLARLGGALDEAIAPHGQAYRLGGDEFCAIVDAEDAELGRIAEGAREALSEQGQGFKVGSSCGMVVLPREASSPALALSLADERLYSNKGHSRRAVVTRQTSDALMQVLQECQPGLGDHLHDVGELASRLGRELRLSPAELEEVIRAAELHDIGKIALPEQILSKPGPLGDDEWDFVRQHTLVGDRIISAAPDLERVAKLVRATHEHYDGSGYPDGKKGDEIPFGARIVAVCDAFHAMTSGRPYREAVSVEEALAELRRCAGSQFDPVVVKAFEEVLQSVRPETNGRARLVLHPDPPVAAESGV